MSEVRAERISRRTVLRGAGAVLALPWLEAMAPRVARAAATAADPSRAVRMAALFFPNGVRQDCWTPEKTGFDWIPPRQLVPLAPLG